jgi:PhnB protein
MPITPYLTVKNAAVAIDFYKTAFGATELYRLDMGGAVGHAELKMDETVLMLSDEFPDMGVLSPETLGGSGVGLHMYVPDVDAAVERAVAAGAKVVRPVEDQFYGDRSGKLMDPFGHVWWLATHKEDLMPEEIQRRATALYGG